jgi:glycosyltransferase involved in cell wall biosynthesis
VLSAVIVVPCYNEAARLDPEAFNRFLARESNVRLLFVDDGSSDATADVVRAFGREWPGRVSLLQLGRNQGKAEAVRRGILDAATLGSELIGYWDADLATPLTEIPAMASAFANNGVGMVIGSRVRLLGRDVHRSAFRHYFGRAFATFASMQLRVPVYDTQCGAKLFRAAPAIVALFSRPFRLRWCFDVEVLARFNALGQSCGACIEHPVSRWVDAAGSKLTLRQALRVLPELARLPSVMRDERRRMPLLRSK